jgi:tetratricopeptide (TPR) repeat protein
MYLEPWEVLASGHDAIRDAVAGGPAAYRLACVAGDGLTQQTRLWHRATGLTFRNPVYEELPGPAPHLGAVVLGGPPDRTAEALDILGRWHENQPLAAEPYYYEAAVMLLRRRWAEFMSLSEQYLFRARTAAGADMARTMTRYYRGQVQAHVNHDYREAVRDAISCLAARPLMAEFWCLLADTYYARRQYETARVFYHNALVLGGRRLRTDDWPLEIPKYKQYPEKMLAACDAILARTEIMVSRS